MYADQDDTLERLRVAMDRIRETTIQPAEQLLALEDLCSHIDRLFATLLAGDPERTRNDPNRAAIRTALVNLAAHALSACQQLA